MNDYSSNTGIYPQLDAESYRLTTSREILVKLQEQEKRYESVRFSKVFQNIFVSTGSLSVLFSMSGLGTSLSGYGIVVGVPLGAIGGCCGLISVASGLYAKKLTKKVSKHEQTAVIARTKLNSIQDLISKGLADGKLSEEEFSRIQEEAETFDSMKLKIRQSHRVNLEKKEIGRSEIALFIKEVAESMQKLRP